jgi:RimJ/RimL family protein N-acetyltransferase
MNVAETDRLVLAKVTLKDAPFFFELMNSPKWIQFIGDRNIKSIKAAENHLKKTILKCYKEFGFGFYKVLLKSEDHRIIGISGLVKREELDDVDIGFGFLPGYEGKGYGFESAVEVLKLAKEKFNLSKVTAITVPANTNSIHLIEKLGLVYQKRINPFEDDEELMLFAIKL